MYGASVSVGAKALSWFQKIRWALLQHIFRAFLY